jgi:hypothetical protein
MRRSLQVSLIAVFGALHAVLYFISFGLWRNWGIYLEAVEGIVLGPKIGFLAAFLGSSVARARDFNSSGSTVAGWSSLVDVGLLLFPIV